MMIIIEYPTIHRELIEMLSKSFTYRDLNTLGQDIFGKKYDTHKLEKIGQMISISPAKAAQRLVEECMQNGKLEILALMLLQLDGNYMNDKIVKIVNLENFLYHQAQCGVIYDHKKKKFRNAKQDTSLMPNWGSLRDEHEYMITVCAIDIVKNSVLVKRYGESAMEKVYKRLLGFLREILKSCDGRVWSWQGDGGLVAFPDKQDVNLSVLCCMNILLSLPVFNLHPQNPIQDDIVLRIALDRGIIKFHTDTGNIVSETINYASHLEESVTKSWGISVSEEIHEELYPRLKKIFVKKVKFEGRFAHSKVIAHDPAIVGRPINFEQ